jgi:ABC-type nickel/cobalt efflux system permease component RcnA
MAILALCASSAIAHPMGNFSVSRYMRFAASGAELRMTYALDLAEIPTFELTHQWGLDNPSIADIEKRAALEMRNWAGALEIEVNGKRIAPSVNSVRATATDGAGAMPVVLITARLTAPLPSDAVRLVYRDPNFADRSGWKEVVLDRSAGREIVAARGTAADVSKALTAYPTDPAYAPPQRTSAEIEWAALETPAAPRVADPEPPSGLVVAPKPAPAGTVAKGDFLSTLLSREEIPTHLALLGLAVAFGIGAMHAMSPGHGKTLMAAYLVGTRGTMKHAAILGGTVTFTHTVSVFLLGLATLFLSKYFLPEKIVPWLGAVSGAMIVAVGLSLFRRRLALLRGKPAAAHTHSHSHGGIVHRHDHEHGHDDGGGHHHHHLPEGGITLGSLVALGVSGGLAPCPSALVILLSAIAIGRTGLGMLLLVAFSLGLASVLIAVGAIVLYAKHLIPSSASIAQGRVAKLVPVASAAVIVAIGVVMTGASIGVFKAPGS